MDLTRLTALPSTPREQTAVIRCLFRCSNWVFTIPDTGQSRLLGKVRKGAPQALPFLLNRSKPVLLSKLAFCPFTPPGKVRFIVHGCSVGKPTKGFQPFTRQGSLTLDPSPGLVPGFAWIQTGTPTHSLAKGLVCYTNRRQLK